MSVLATDSHNVIDFISRDTNGRVVLICVDEGTWDGSTERVVALQDKLQAYAVYALDGVLVRDYPELAGLPVCIELRCVHPPDAVTMHFLSVFQEVLKDRGLPLTIKQVRRQPPAH